MCNLEKNRFSLTSGVGINGAPVLEHHLEFTQLIIFTTKYTPSLREYHY